MKYYLTFIFGIIICGSLSAQNFWKSGDEFHPQISRKVTDINLPLKYHPNTLELSSLKQHLKVNKSIELVYPDGKINSFDVEEIQLMEPLLAQKYSSIKTYKGINKNTGDKVRFDINFYEFHASIVTRSGNIYIDPYGEENFYLSYYIKDQSSKESTNLSCGTLSNEIRDNHRSTISSSSRMEGENLHTFRLALACTGEWGEVRGTKEKAIADMVSAVSRLNQIFEIEIGTRMILINNNDHLIHLNPQTDPYPVGDVGGQVLSVNNDVINNILLSTDLYDLGHVLTGRCTDVGGVAFLSSICGPNKGGGVTCAGGLGVSSRVINIAAHEIGHQMGARHTFNNCGGNESFGNDFEPGSGSTIMSYAGGCGINNVTANGDSYYHQASLYEMYNLTRSENSPAYDCSEKVATDNHYPEVNVEMENGFYIPKSTPFYLYGKASDIDEDDLTFTWEEKDSSLSAAELGSPIKNSPLFRSLPPSSSLLRILPNKNNLLKNLSSVTEVLPAYEREIHFALTARDNNPEVGLASWDFLQFNVDGDAGPFLVTSLSVPQTIEAGSSIDITWDVANTDNARINCQSVDIFLSIDDGLHESEDGFIKIASSVPNIGISNIVLPNIITERARIVVRASNNIFFDISDSYFTILPPSQPLAYFSLEVPSNDMCIPFTNNIEVKTESFAGYDGNIRFETSSINDDIKTSFNSDLLAIGDSTTLMLEFPSSLKSGIYAIDILGISDSEDTIKRTISYNLTSVDYSDFKLLSPTNGIKNATDQIDFSWTAAQNASEYQIEISDNPNFESPLISEFVQDTSYLNLQTFVKSKRFYWRVIPINQCGEGLEYHVRAFSTPFQDCETYEAEDLPKNISQSGTSTIESILTVPTGLTIEDINITKVGISHENMKDLQVSVVSPNNTEVLLWQSQCPRSTNSIYSFDDASPRFFSCATNVEGSFNPQQPLSAFNNEEAKGQWKLVVSDKQNENGGTLNSFEIEFCGNVESSSPYIINNKLVEVKHLGGIDITNNLLSAGDDNTPNQDLIFTILKTTINGNLLLDGIPMEEGDSFLQKDLDNKRLKYRNSLPAVLEEGKSAEDFFEVIVTNQEDGWIGIESVQIEINADFTSKTLETDKISKVRSLNVYPNPTDNILSVELKNTRIDLDVQIFDITGRLIVQKEINRYNNTLDVTELKQGLYFIKGFDGTHNYSSKFVVFR